MVSKPKPKAVEAKGDWECLDPDCVVKVRRDSKMRVLETRLMCSTKSIEHAQTFQRDFADPTMRKRITVEPKGGD